MKKIFLMTLILMGLAVSSAYAFGGPREKMKDVLQADEIKKTSGSLTENQKKPSEMLKKADQETGKGEMFEGKAKISGYGKDN